PTEARCHPTAPDPGRVSQPHGRRPPLTAPRPHSRSGQLAGSGGASGPNRAAGAASIKQPDGLGLASPPKSGEAGGRMNDRLGRCLIERTRLTEHLELSEARLILLLAPAGYGKTSLARQWVQGDKRAG